MKRIIAILAITFFMRCSCVNQEEYFLQGNKYYIEGSFKDALDVYQKIDHKGSAVLFNIGNCYFNLGDVPRAIAYWLLADNNGSWSIHKKVDHNCELAYKKMGKEYMPGILHSLYCSFVNVLAILPILWWQILFLMIWLFSVIIFVYAVGNRRLLRIIFLLFLICSTMICFVIRYKNTSCTCALIVDEQAVLRVGPSDNYGVVAMVNRLDTMKIDARHNNWFKVHNREYAGWICDKDVMIIDAKL